MQLLCSFLRHGDLSAVCSVAFPGHTQRCVRLMGLAYSPAPRLPGTWNFFRWGQAGFTVHFSWSLPNLQKHHVSSVCHCHIVTSSELDEPRGVPQLSQNVVTLCCAWTELMLSKYLWKERDIKIACMFFWFDHEPFDLSVIGLFWQITPYFGSSWFMGTSMMWNGKSW